MSQFLHTTLIILTEYILLQASKGAFLPAQAYFWLHKCKFTLEKQWKDRTRNGG